MKLKQRIKSRSGFSLAEMLVTVIILLLVSTIVATGVPAARNAYLKVVIGANAKTLLSTTIAALRDELTTAQNVKVNGTTITYYSADDGATSEISLVGNVIMLEEYIDTIPVPGTNVQLHSSISRKLVSAKAITNDLCVKYEGVKQPDDSQTITFSKLAVYWGDKELASVSPLTIRCIVPSPTPETA